MKNIYSISLLFVCWLSSVDVHAQLVTLSPPNANGDDAITITFDANEGGKELLTANKVYVHAGVVTDAPDGTEWQHVVGNWGNDDGVGEMTPVDGEPGKWKIILAPSARAYFGVPEGTNMFRLSLVFRNAAGDKKATINSGTYDWGYVASNGDIYIDLAMGEFIQVSSPFEDEVFLATGESFLIKAEASSEVSAISVLVKEGDVFVEKAQETSGTSIAYNYTPTGSGNLEIKITATIEGEEIEFLKTVKVFLRQPGLVEALPADVKKGINYHQEDLTKVTLVLEAPNKAFAYVVGDFTNWQVLEEYQMKQTPDGEVFWLEVDGLTSGEEYIFQYWVEGTIKIGDPYADKVVDPWNDQYIPEEVYPDLINYDKTDYQMATVLQTNQSPYVWATSEASWQKPPKEELVIYELLLRDFLGSRSYSDLTDTLSYLKRLGVNAIGLMPIMEFEGNDSWGYNPAYFFAPDKYYGTKDDLKRFIETAHQHGMAVILDMVLNHAFGQNAMVKMYWDAANNTVSDDSPWFNPIAKHPFNVGYDFNHESPYTQSFVDSVNQYWLEEYHFDGYRFDLSKGFTQKNSGDNVGAWGNYDASRIALLKRMADKIWESTPDAYVILEHFADNSEEKELAEYRAEEGKGMMLWGNLNHAYNQNTMGYASESNIDWIYHSTRSWSVPHVVGYMESHDEERLVHKNIAYGRSTGSYNVKDSTTAISRIKAAGVLFYTLPGPKMLWQFGELGYDYSINWCANGTIGDCRLVPKPPRWDYLQNKARKSLFDHTADLLRLRKEFNVFRTGDATFYGANELVKQVTLTNAANTASPANADEMNVQLVVNFDVTSKIVEVKFPDAGTWYDYYAGGKAVVVGTNAYTISLRPGEYKLYTNYPIEAPDPVVVDGIIPIEDFQIMLYPNPVHHVLSVTEGKYPIEQLSLRTIHGKVIYPKKIAYDQWDLSTVSSGLYLVNIQVNGKAYHTKIVKQ